MEKLKAFDYLVNRLTQWYQEQGGNWVNNDLSKLKLTKLLFFVSASSVDGTDPGLLTTFDNFVAMPYGHVESDVQDQIDQSEHYVVTRGSLSYREGIDISSTDLAPEDLNAIDNAVNKLKKINPELILYDPFKLVDISHKWQSWKTVFSLAKQNGKFSMRIPISMIIAEPKIFL